VHIQIFSPDQVDEGLKVSNNLLNKNRSLDLVKIIKWNTFMVLKLQKFGTQYRFLTNIIFVNVVIFVISRYRWTT
jgi:hypothetical protein